ncbi:TetR family transcriptional regulator [Rathayibacter sp. VKM Ac-2804]|uniref:TetR/AcrR family transcriptional regulator n=1 Tax=Rathayibacter sp. VKM Ac-2804 TaxID=2609257 RepID=UPI00132F4821|nr:TetR/AcrR family transcriptional regulator [Rathayibacter sp. VKM Ac-2804]QHF24533.1 TetR family transcriptional regulator [Rathayibacter sp. VKM Ac-2804]
MPRRSPADLSAGIREAAERLFRERGYSRVTIREIAAEAQVDPAVVIRRSGSKEALFLEVMQVSIRDRPELDVPLQDFGRTFLATMLEDERDTQAVFLALVRGGSEPAIGARLRAVHEEAFVAPLRARMAGSDADLRARLAAALVGGLLHSMWVVGDEVLLATDHDRIVERYGDALQSLLTPGT